MENKVGKWAKSPQTIDFTWFFVAKSIFQKWAESGQVGLKMTKFHKNPSVKFPKIPTNLTKTGQSPLFSFQKWAEIYQCLLSLSTLLMLFLLVHG